MSDEKTEIKGRFKIIKPAYDTKKKGRFIVKKPIESNENSTPQNEAPTTGKSRFKVTPVTTVPTPRMNVGTTIPRLLKTSGAPKPSILAHMKPEELDTYTHKLSIGTRSMFPDRLNNFDRIRIELNASVPPFNMTELPDLKHREATSDVTLGLLS